jgi:[glutamine synthetase] adenylyltransferase / [glutamine synthetase]-adenylyl-L-tyrosine phosphorylase
MEHVTPTLIERLAAAGCRRPDAGAENLARLAPDPAARAVLDSILPTFLTALGRAADPDLALNNLERYTERALNRSFLLSLFQGNPRILHLALTIFGSSQFLSDILIRQPQLFEWLLEPGVLHRPKDTAELLAEARRLADGARQLEQKWAALRRFKAQEILRIGLADLIGRQSLVGVTEELSNLADALVEAAYQMCRADLVARHGRPEVAGPPSPRECAFVVLGMGKLGGRELNFSSDIDLIFVYEEEGETVGRDDGAGRISHYEFFRKLGELLVKGLSEPSVDGHLYRVDMRLRPEGRTGAIACALRSCEVYYESWGQGWERQALIKARPIAGSAALGATFLSLLAPFVYRQSLDLGALDDIRAMKDRINLSLAQEARAKNVKLGFGGIREIEFLVQGLQLLHGGKNRWVREPNTLRSLHRLESQGILADPDYELLVRAYTFLRRLEHRLQILHDRQTHTLPDDPAELGRVARRMGYHPPDHPDPAAALLGDFERHTAAVRQLYDSFLGGTRSVLESDEAAPDEIALFFTSDLPSEQVRSRLKAVGFDDVERALRNFTLLREGQPAARLAGEVRRALGRLAPGLLTALAASPDPDLALSQFERFVAGLPARTTFVRLLADTPGLLALLVRLFGTSEFLSATLLRQPELLDSLLAPEPAARHGQARVLNDLRPALAVAPAGSGKLDALRRVKKAEELRIGLADIRGEIEIPDVLAALTSLAGGCLTAALELAQADLAPRFGAPDPAGVVLIGMGKLGGIELGYGSDLDLFVVYRDEGRTTGPERISHPEYFSKLADRTSTVLTSITQEGAAYRVDTRLRPGGQKGEAAVSLPALEQYLARQADLWERQAYVKARPVAGDAALAESVTACLRRFVYERTPEPDLAARILAMRQRIETERVGAKNKAGHVKLGTGGIMDIEFLTQYLQLRHGGECLALRTPHTLAALAALRAAGLLAAAEAACLEDSYRFLRQVETRLRIVADLSLSTLPAAPARLEKLARRMGYASAGPQTAREQFQGDYARHTSRVREIFARVFATGDRH